MTLVGPKVITDSLLSCYSLFLLIMISRFPFLFVNVALVVPGYLVDRRVSGACRANVGGAVASGNAVVTVGGGISCDIGRGGEAYTPSLFEVIVSC